MTGPTVPLQRSEASERKSVIRRVLASQLTGVIVGAMLAAVPTYAVAHDQIRAADKLAAREKQQTIYEQFIDDEATLSGLQMAFLADKGNALTAGTGPPGFPADAPPGADKISKYIPPDVMQELAAQAQKISDFNEKLGHDVAILKVDGTTRTTKLAVEIARRDEHWTGALLSPL